MVVRYSKFQVHALGLFHWSHVLSVYKRYRQESCHCCFLFINDINGQNRKWGRSGRDYVDGSGS